MKLNRSILSAAIVAGLGFAAQVHAQETQQTPAANDKVKDIETITVVGVRGSLEKSLDTKKEAASHVEVVTAEDIGKLPAKNVADTLQRLPGVNISSSSATEGGFDESDRISLRGGSPSLTQTLVNGHTVGTGDWFVLSQVQTVGRSVSYSLLPAEIVSQVVIHKTSEAKLTEGGSAGSVNIVTRRPLQFADEITTEASVGGVYADLPGKTDPQFNGLFNWRNADSSAGVMFQAFYEKRNLRRDGQEVVGGFNKIAATDPVVATNPDLAGVLYPNLLGAVLFEQERTRKGGVLDAQFKPTDNLTLGLNAFYSKLEADNYNRNYMLWTSQFASNVAPLPGYKIVDGVLTNATYANQPGSTTPYGVYDQISRPGAASESKYIAVDADWQVSDSFNLKFQGGKTEGHGKSPQQDVIELGTAAGGGASWGMNGALNPIDWSLGGNNASPSGILPANGWIFGANAIDALDEEKWYQADGEFTFTEGALASLDFGVRYSDHTRENLFEIAQGPKGDWQNLANYPLNNFHNYPGDFASGIGGSHPNNIWYWTPEQLAAFNAQFANRDPVARFFWQDSYSVNEKTTAAFIQANFQGDRWSGNLGLRWVRTKQDTIYNTGAPEENTVQGPITGSAFGNYFRNRYENTYKELLPSLNLKYEFTDELIGRFAASKTLTRPDFSALAGSVSLDDLTHSGSGGNPKLEPIVSTNLDVSLEWYFAPRALLAASIYQMDLDDYVAFGTETRTFLDQQATTNNGGVPVFADYRVSVPVNSNAKIKGFELTYEQPIGDNWGVAANYTYADSSSDSVKPVFGTSRDTYNVSGYFENDKFNARLSYTYRSEFYAGVSRTDDFFQDSIGNLSASLGYKVNDWMTVTLDALNLNDPELKYYSQVNGEGRKLPYAFYENGRQYYVNFRFRF
ncbi:TonB-dependent receptor [Luteimonas gilva]|uniref:TonB-dependent receptor n=1 Tax=Luteimonas gilva TaxID=2572684 RepID=A0A4U5JIM8_9GAMM|nr:TonB-dependent receptor [Luteimonas gilva]TKR29372.1 TonB-dependent receptor [Luteimonas gilva]